MLEAIILGVIQGVTEFLPISSTAHLILIPEIFGWNGIVNSLTFDISLHAGTLLAVLIYFYKDWWRIITSERRLLLLLIIGTVPACVAGLLLEEIVESALRDPYIISFSCASIGLFMLYADRRAGSREIKDLTLLDTLFIGVFQAIALIPGVSRSGITMSAGFLRGLSRSDSARFSFLLSTPVIAGATLIGVRRLISQPDLPVDIFSAGMLSSFISGLLAIRFLLRYLQTHRIDLFVWYRIGLAIAIVLYLHM